MAGEFSKYLAEVLRRQAAVEGAKTALQQLNNPAIHQLYENQGLGDKRKELIRRAEEVLNRTTRS